MEKGFNPKNFMWGAIVVIVVSVIAYALISGRGINEIAIDSGGGLRIKIADQQQGPSQYARPSSGTQQSKGTGSDYSIQVPGERPLSFNRITRFLVIPGSDDPQNRHLSLLKRALEESRVNILYKESDPVGEFSLWLTEIGKQGGRRCANYVTRLIESDGSIEVGLRLACKKGEEWVAQISPDLLALLGRNEQSSATNVSPQAEILSVGAIKRCLDLHRSDINRGLFSGRRLINACFVSLPLTSNEFDRAERKQLALAKQLKLTMEAAKPIEFYGYDLYLKDEFIGSRTVFQALALLSAWNPYYHNMVGSNEFQLRRYGSALNSFDRAIEEWPEYTHALLNRGRTLLKLNRPSEALLSLRTVLSVDDEPGRPSAKEARRLIAELSAK